MEGTLRVIGWMERRAGVWGVTGSLLLLAYWNSLARDLALPTLLTVALELASATLFTGAVIGHQLRQGTHPSSWVGWGGAAAVGTGFAGSLLLTSAGIILVGLAITRCRVHRPSTGILLTAGATALMLSTSLAPGFGTDQSVPMGAGWLLVMNGGLVLIAGAMTDLAVSENQEPRSTARA